VLDSVEDIDNTLCLDLLNGRTQEYKRGGHSLTIHGHGMWSYLYSWRTKESQSQSKPIPLITADTIMWFFMNNEEIYEEPHNSFNTIMWIIVSTHK
jgi:hypothetical protein